MGSLKTFAVAGLLATVSTAALAADLMPAPVLAPPPAYPVEVGGGWYLRGDVGVGDLDLRRFDGVDSAEFRAFAPETTVAGYYRPELKSLGSQAFVGAGIGYQLNNWVRFDATAEYRGGSTLRFAESYAGGTFGGVPVRGLDFYHGNLSSVVALANVYFDLGTWHGVTPFVGAGIGGAFHHLSGMYDLGAGTAAGGAGTFADHDTTSLAWALHAGLGYSVTPNLKLEVAYRYLNMGNVDSGGLRCFNVAAPNVCPGTTYSFKDIESHDIKIGMRWMLGGPVAAPVMAEAPLLAPPPGPLVRKY